MAVFAGYSISLWKKFGCSLCTDVPLPSEKLGTTANHRRLSPRFFLRGGGRLCTDYSAEVQEGTNKRIQSSFKLPVEHFIKFISRELFTCLFQRLLRLTRMAKFYPPN